MTLAHIEADGQLLFYGYEVQDTFRALRCSPN